MRNHGASHKALKMVAAVGAMSLITLVGCGSDGGGPAGVAGGGAATSGVFLDSAVEGLQYIVGGKSGMTDGTGKFDFDGSAMVSFQIGDITIGQSAPLPVTTPVNLVPNAFDENDPTVTNIASFLQTIDDDGDANNGIKITDAVRQAAAGKSIDFAQDLFSFPNDANVQAAVSELTQLTQAGERALVTPQAAQDHLRETLINSYGGQYTGVFRQSGQGDNLPDVGWFNFTLNGSALDGDGEIYGVDVHFTGTVASDGSVSGSGGGSTSFYAQIEWDQPTISRGGGHYVVWGEWYGSNYYVSMHGQK